MLKFFNKHNVRQHSPAIINSYKLLATFTSGAGRLSKRRSKRRSVNPALRVEIRATQAELRTFGQGRIYLPHQKA